MLETLTRVAAPLIPLVSERVWQGLTGGRSVHLQDWPDADAFPAADDIRSAMDAVREVSSVANALRKQEGKRVRLPLARLTVVVPDAASLAQFEDILRDELNVKSVELVELKDDTAKAYGITHRLSVNARAAGPRLGKQVQQVDPGRTAGDWAETDGVVTAGRHRARARRVRAGARDDRSARGRSARPAPERRLPAARHHDHA